MTRDERRNILLTTVLTGLRAAAMLCATGTLMQTFLNVIGFSEDQIYVHSALLQAANVLAILLGARWGDSKGLLKRAAWIQLPYALLFLCYLPLCVLKNANAGAYLLLLAVGAIQSALAGLYTVCDYKIPYVAFTEKGYGYVLSFTGISSAAATLGAGILITALTERIPYVRLMTWGIMASAVLVLASMLLQGCMKQVGQLPVQTPAHDARLPLKDILLSPIFRNMIPANFSRGFAMGAITVMPIMALSMGYGQSVATAMVSVQSVAMVAGSVLFGLMSSRLRPGLMILLGSLSMATAGFMLIRGQYLFLCMYALVNLGKIVVDYAVPAALRWSVPAEIAGPYNAWRLIIHNIGTILGSLAASFIPVGGVLLLAVVGQLFSGWSYYSAKVMKNK